MPKPRAHRHSAITAHLTLRVIPARLIPVYVPRSTLAFAAFATFVLTTFILAFATLAGMLPRGVGTPRVADDMARLGRAHDLPPLAFPLALAAFVFAALADLIDRRRHRLRRRFGQDRLARLRDDESPDAHPQFRTHKISLLAKSLAA
jgi:hypothetical protein